MESSGSGLVIISYANIIIILRAEKQSRLTHKSSFTTVESWKVYVLKCVQQTFSNSYVLHWGIMYIHQFYWTTFSTFYSCSWVKNYTRCVLKLLCVYLYHRWSCGSGVSALSGPACRSDRGWGGEETRSHWQGQTCPVHSHRHR